MVISEELLFVFAHCELDSVPNMIKPHLMLTDVMLIASWGGARTQRCSDRSVGLRLSLGF